MAGNAASYWRRSGIFKCNYLSFFTHISCRLAILVIFNKSPLLFRKLFIVFTFIGLLPGFAAFAQLNSLKADSLLKLMAGKRATDTVTVSLYTQLAWCYLDTDSAKTIGYLQKSRALAQQLSYSKGLWEGYNNIGMAYAKYGRIDTAMHYFDLGLQSAEQSKNAQVAAKYSINIASVYLNQAKYADAIRYYIGALRYLDTLNDQGQVAVTQHCIGIAYYLLKNYRLSLSYYAASIATEKKSGKPVMLGYSYNGMGAAFKELNNYDSALYYLQQGREVATKNADKALMSSVLSNIGAIYGQQAKTTEALEYLDKALALQNALGDKRGIAETSIAAGDVYVKLKNYGKAIQYYDAAKGIASAIGLNDILKEAWKGLSSAYAGLGNYKASLEAYSQYASIKDSLYTKESTAQIAEMQTRYNTEKKEQDNRLLQKENDIKALQLAKERNKEYLLLAIFILALFTAAVYYNRYRLRQKNILLQERELRAHAVFRAQEDEKTRLSKHLHDGVGALLSLAKLNISGIEPDAANEKLLNSTKKLVGDAITEVRGISHELMPGTLAKAGLRAALDEMLEQLSTGNTLKARLSYDLHQKIAPSAELNIYRIVQEACNNIIKHAEARNIEVMLRQDAGRLSLKVTDDGRGFDKDALKTGNGLNNIYSRADIMKATVSISTNQGQGTVLDILIPLKQIAYAG